jgi:hypothetical protein
MSILRLVEPFGSATLRILLRCGRPVLPCTGVRRHAAHPCPRSTSASQAREPDRCASAHAFAAAQSVHPVPPFDRFDEILYLVENASDFTLPDSQARRLQIRCDFLSQLLPALKGNSSQGCETARKCVHREKVKMTSELFIFGRFHAKEGLQDQLAGTINDVLTPTRQEPGM